MADHSVTARGETGPLPADHLTRTLAVADPEDPALPHISLAGDNYTVLLSGKQTEGRYCLIDMLVPDGGGPPPHRHDFEEMFTLLGGELEFTFRGETRTVKAPSTVNIPANAPHQFKNKSGEMVHMLCMCTPAGQEEFFTAVGVPIGSRASPAPQLSDAEQAAKRKLAEELSPKYRSEFLKHA
jgi:quercetin dioxygenase-like cupin family protein